VKTATHMDLRTLAFAMVAVLACADKASVDIELVIRILRANQNTHVEAR
jgi:hypothetical protein